MNGLLLFFVWSCGRVPNIITTKWKETTLLETPTPPKSGAWSRGVIIIKQNLPVIQTAVGIDPNKNDKEKMDDRPDII